MAVQIQKLREQIEDVMNFIDDEINELDVSFITNQCKQSFKDAIHSLKKYLSVRNNFRQKMAKSVDHYNNYVISRNIEGVRNFQIIFVLEEKA